MHTTLRFIRFYVKLRLLQTKRIFGELGIGYILFWIILVTLVFLSIYEKMLKSSSIYLSLFVLLPIVALHAKRKDESILRHLLLSPNVLFCIDNILVSLLILILIGFSQSFVTTSLSLILILLSSLFPLFTSNNFKKVQSIDFIPLELYEWRIGIRQNFSLIFIIYLVGILAVAYWGVAIIIFSFLLLSFINTFFDPVEPKEWITIPFSIPHKIIQHIQIWSLSLMPYILTIAFFQPTYWYLILIAWMYGVIMITFFIAYKYAVWSPFRRTIGFGVVGSLFLLLTITIAGAFFTIIATLYYYQKARKNPYLTLC